MEARTGNLGRTSTQRGNATIDKRCSYRCLRTSHWLCERVGVSKPAQLPVCVRMQAEIQGLPLHDEIVTACPGRSAVGARKSDRLAALKSGDPLYTPTAYKLVHGTAGVRHEVLALADRDLIAATEVEYVADIKVCQTEVALDSKAWDRGRAETS